ncbi:uncharacterized protein FOMMEDRAFT_150557 [Fomitiporia mediterranea MF3/22]|uniref:uncharacterized protein n=1 Tax=Fomitiporia mediterranea (strain MF3/22) TaxID=694068 RepID=UPI00044096FB|nr:uncharacterized protein FOMMEDRAFT_150557 [Fomitiporia mediterranea MF3/22]EJD07951.1 hypothetical protein FOMMEDRAFT_150557 [Fomitiporia mediterranea MF3/22]
MSRTRMPVVAHAAMGSGALASANTGILPAQVLRYTIMTSREASLHLSYPSSALTGEP